MEVVLATNVALLHEQVLEDLQPRLALKNLEIISYMGKKLPSWMACKQGYLKCLTEIKLVNLRKCERLPPLGQLPGLETVEISGMESISAVDDAFYGDGGTFRWLQSLIFSEMPMLERWLMAKGWQNLEGVRELEISGCEELRCLPPGIMFLEFLRRLEIIRCNNLTSLPELTSLDWSEKVRVPIDLVVQDCAMLSFIPERLKQSP
ncbi:unnamed protein product, partial [Musa textilis]